MTRRGLRIGMGVSAVLIVMFAAAWLGMALGPDDPPAAPPRCPASAVTR